MFVASRSLNIFRRSIISSSSATPTRLFHSCRPVLGLEEFIEIKKPNEQITNGRSWTPSDLRKKSFDDLHKLHYILYKERNLLLTEREKLRRNKKPVTVLDENRYRNVKRSMANIQFVLTERNNIEKLIADEKVAKDATEAMQQKGETTAP